MRNHVFLAEPSLLAKFADSLAQSSEEGSIVDHGAVLTAHKQKHHEQSSMSRLAGQQGFVLTTICAENRAIASAKRNPSRAESNGRRANRGSQEPLRWLCGALFDLSLHRISPYQSWPVLQRGGISLSGRLPEGRCAWLAFP